MSFPAANPFLTRFLDALQYRDFRRMWMANAFAQASAWGLIVTRGWLIFSETDSAFLVGVATFGAFGPQLLIPPVIGVLADRMDRRTLLSWTYGVNTAQNLGLFLLALSGVLEVWHLVAFSVLNGAARAAQLPTSQALAASLVPRESLLNALSLTASAQHASRLAGPALVTPLLSLVGAPAAFLVCTLFYIVGWVNIRSIAPRPVERGLARSSFIENFAGGLMYVYSRPILRFIIVMAFLHCGLTMAFESLLPAFSSEHLTGSPTGFGTLMMGVGAGALVASILVSGIQTTRARGAALVAMGLMSGVGQILLGLTSTLWLATLAAATMGGAQAAFMTMCQAVTQSIAADEYRGRVASINVFSLGGIMATMNLLNGSLDSAVGARTLLLAEGLVFAVVVLLSMALVTGRRVYRGARVMEATQVYALEAGPAS